MVPLAGIIDTAFLGHLAEIQALAGVAIATVIFNVMYWSFGFLRMGTTGLIAQAVGQRDVDQLHLTLLRNGALALGLGLLLVAGQVPIRQVGFHLLSVAPDVRAAGEAFFTARIWGSPAVLMNYVVLGWFLGRGQGDRLMLLSLVSNGSNILLDALFIQRFGWGSAGAGTATTLSQGLMLAVGLLCLHRDISWGRVWVARRRFTEAATFQVMLQLNRDLLIRTFALVMSFALFTHWSAQLSTEILAANTLLLQVVTLAAYFIDGIAFATESFAGQFAGSGDRAKLKKLLYFGVLSSVLVGTGFAIAFAGLPHPLFRLMTSHNAILAETQRLSLWLLPTLILGAIAYLLDGYFLGLTEGHALRQSTLVAAGLGFLPTGLAAQWVGSVHLLWLAMVALMGLRALTLVVQVPRTLQAGSCSGQNCEEGAVR
ncbi:MAG: MATE family efflux transporter [Leptolyngbyaceae cyanobacterium T60_A2020_046]|nr:MATE family efflux transporter [Leptolyngbyaceae cyanobacterium T60_A2020_046]